jgi:hypothetical protein
MSNKSEKSSPRYKRCLKSQNGILKRQNGSSKHENGALNHKHTEDSKKQRKHVRTQMRTTV